MDLWVRNKVSERNNSPAIVVIAYNRVNCLKRVLNSIKEANYSHDNIKPELFMSIFICS